MKFKAEQDRPMKQPRRKPRRKGAAPLAAHPVFAPLLGVWGAALVGLSILVLPGPMMLEASKGTGLMLLGNAGQLVLAGFAAVVVGGVTFLVASQMTRKAHRRADTPSIVSVASRRVRTIDPARELGSLRLDDPVVTVPFAATKPQSERDAAPALVAEPRVPVAEADSAPAPRALELAEFAQLPGRNAVWVEDVAPVAEPVAAAPAPEPQPVAPQRASLTPVADTPRMSAPRLVAHPGDAALARLRETAPEQLSLAEMVERFAGALHEHRETAPGRPMTPQDIAAREAALAQALRALAALSGGASQAPANVPLAESMTRLHGVRGAA